MNDKKHQSLRLEKITLYCTPSIEHGRGHGQIFYISHVHQPIHIFLLFVDHVTLERDEYSVRWEDFPEIVA